jgi:hypothetical protein
VELHAGDPPRLVDKGRGRRVGALADQLEAGRQRRHPVAVRHPHRQLLAGAEAAEQAVVALHRHVGAAVLVLVGRQHLAAQQPGDQLGPVADAEHRHAQLEDLGRHGRRVRVVAGRRPARQHDAARPHLPDPLQRQRVRVDLGVHAVLAHPAGDELGVLRPEIEDEDRLALRGHSLVQSTR